MTSAGPPSRTTSPVRLVVAQPLVRGRAQLAALRPLAELDVGHELRLDEYRAARGPRLTGRVERRAVALERAEQRA